MTNEEAIRILRNAFGISDDVVGSAVSLAIKALSQQTEDAYHDCEHCAKTYGTLGCCTTISNRWVYSCEEGHREYWEKQKLKHTEDAISRQAAISNIREMAEWHTGDAFNADRVIQHLKNLPSVTPKQRTGRWIYTDYHNWCCSECGGNPHRGTGFVPNKDGMKIQWKYCNLCGAKMEEQA